MLLTGYFLQLFLECLGGSCYDPKAKEWQMRENDSNLHQCSLMPKNGIDIFYSGEGEGGLPNVWNLVVRREATEEDLEKNHYLEDVGETIWETLIEISHCPFCGFQLSSEKPAQEGKFLHRDYSGWSMKTF